jgi:hypothetical protein
MISDSLQNLSSAVESRAETWKAELRELLQDPRVRKFTELQEKIDEADAFIVEANPSHLSNPLSPFDPYDAYDAFEFARDLMGREVSTLELSKLANGRFPDLSDESRRLMIHYLIENGAAEVARKTGSGRPTAYRFRTPGRGGVVGRRLRLGIPENELSSFKMDDLEEVSGLVLSAPV